jgi:hypothetical protein
MHFIISHVVTPSLSAQDSVVFESGKAGFVKFLAPW